MRNAELSDSENEERAEGGGRAESSASSRSLGHEPCAIRSVPSAWRRRCFSTSTLGTGRRAASSSDATQREADDARVWIASIFSTSPGFGLRARLQAPAQPAEPAPRLPGGHRRLHVGEPESRDRVEHRGPGENTVFDSDRVAQALSEPDWRRDSAQVPRADHRDRA